MVSSHITKKGNLRTDNFLLKKNGKLKFKPKKVSGAEINRGSDNILGVIRAYNFTRNRLILTSNDAALSESDLEEIMLLLSRYNEIAV